MKQEEVIGMVALKKAQNSCLGQIGASQIFDVSEKWVSEELVSNHMVYEAQSVTEFDDALKSQDVPNILVSSYLVNRPALEKMVMRSPIEHQIFYTTHTEG